MIASETSTLAAMNATKIFLTGGHGFVGSFVRESLAQHFPGCTVLSPSRQELDLTSWEQTHRFFSEHRPTHVVHLAGEVGGIGANRSNPGLFWYANTIMGAFVLECCRIFSVQKLVTAGTVCSYPKYCPVPFSEDSLWEGYPEETNAPYGIAKKSVLIGAQSYYDQYGLKSAYLLPANMYGPRDDFDLNTSHVIPALIRKLHQAKKSQQPEALLWGTGNPTREFLYVEDFARAVNLALERADRPEPINIGSAQHTSIRDLATLVAKVIGYKGSIRFDHVSPDGQPRRALSTKRAETLLQFRAETTLEEGLKRTYEWFLKSAAQ